MNSYAQNWEDIEIEKMLSTKKRGFYVEIGAYHPSRLSNSYRFYKSGWQGVVAEPNPGIRAKFAKIRPRDRFVGVGIGAEGGEMTYYRYLIPALNTFSKKQVKINQKNGYQVWRRDKIEIVEIGTFLKQYVGQRNIDLLSLDTEGWDEKILENWDWRWRPKVICVEANKLSTLLVAKGYEVKFNNGVNLIYGQK